MALPNISGEFTLGSDPELRFTPSGKAVATLRAVASSRKKEGDQWVDDKSCWLNFEAWDKLAENIAESLTRGTKVTITGALEVRDWEDKDGNKRSTPQVRIYSIGPSLAFATARVTKLERSSGGGAQRSGGAAPADDPWATTPTSQAEEPPF